MPRIPVFEFEDQPWLPAVLRNAVTGYLRLVVKMTQQARPVVPALADLLQKSGETRIVDLCSGSGSIAGYIGRQLAARGIPARIVLTDLHPDAEALLASANGAAGLVDVHTAPLDAAHVPADMAGVRTMFNAFHHFEPAVARSILADAAGAGRPIAIVEFMERTPLTLMGVFFSPMLVLVLAPFFRPFRWQVLVLTYLLPLIPLIVFWDGLASWLRVYSLRELEELAGSTQRPGYRWEVGRWPCGPMRVTYVLGSPA